MHYIVVGKCRMIMDGFYEPVHFCNPDIVYNANLLKICAKILQFCKSGAIMNANAYVLEEVLT